MTSRKPFRPFLDMIYKGIPDASWQTDEKQMEGLISARGSARLYLGYYNEEAIREAFQRFSIQARLDELGLGNYRLAMDAANPDSQELRLFPVIDSKRAGLADLEQEPIAEVITREALLSPGVSMVPEPDPCPYLVIQWICLQNPPAKFDKKTLLPGQKYPGLGAGLKILKMLEALIQRLHLEGIINRPEFLHNAMIYSRAFQFVNPETQGRLNAVKHQLGHLTLWQVAWASEKGFIVEDGKKGRFRWYQSEQVWPTCKSMVRYFSSDAYRKKVKETEKNATYTLAPDTPPDYLPARQAVL